MTSLKPPRRALADARGSRSFQPLRLGVARVHAEEIGREERRLFAALAAADLEDRVLLVVRIGRQEQELDLPLERAALRLQLGSSSSHELAQLGIGERLFVLGDLLLERPVAAKRVHERLDLVALLVQLARAACGPRAPAADRGDRRARRSASRAARACRGEASPTSLRIAARAASRGATAQRPDFISESNVA